MVRINARSFENYVTCDDVFDDKFIILVTKGDKRIEGFIVIKNFFFHKSEPVRIKKDFDVQLVFCVNHFGK